MTSKPAFHYNGDAGFLFVTAKKVMSNVVSQSLA